MTKFDDLADSIYESVDGFEKILSFRDAKRAFENAYASVVLERTNGNVTKAALMAQKDRKDLYDLMRRCNVKAKTFRR